MAACASERLSVSLIGQSGIYLPLTLAGGVSMMPSLKSGNGASVIPVSVVK
jgi:hypothetical protein